MSVIRDTNSFLYDLVRNQTSQMATNVAKLEEQAITGRRINRPSDAPTEMVQVNRLREELSNQEVYGRNASWAKSIQGLADQVLNEVTNVFQRASEIAVSMTNEHYNADDRSAAAEEVSELRNHLIVLANTDLGGRHIFSGDAFDTVATGVYQGSTEIPETLVANDQWVDVGFDGSDAFQGDVDAFQVLADLQTALSTNVPTDVAASITDVQDAAKQAISVRQAMGHQYSKADDAELLASNLRAEFTTHLDSVVGANEGEVYMQLQQARTAYTAALQVAAGGLSGNLFDHI